MILRAYEFDITIIKLTFFQAPRSYLVEYPIRNNSYGTLHTSTVGLRFQAQRQHFSPEDGDMKLKCTASIGDIYWQTNEKSAEGLKSKRDSSSNYQSYVHDGDPPQGKNLDISKADNVFRGHPGSFSGNFLIG